MSERKLVGTQEMFKKALEGKYAIGAYNVNNMEILQAIAEAAEETRSPIILQVSAGARKYANQTYLIKLVQAALEQEAAALTISFLTPFAKYITAHLRVTSLRSPLLSFLTSANIFWKLKS